MDPLKWQQFFITFREHPVASTFVLILVIIAITFGGGVVVATGWLNPSPSNDVSKPETMPSMTHFALGPSPTIDAVAPTPTEWSGSSPLQEPCSIISPTNGSKVGGTFSIAGRCKAYAGATVFIVVRDLYPNLNDVRETQQHWMQCGIKIKETGEFVCGAFLCVNAADYEILVVWPPPEAFSAYEDWLDDASQTGKTELPAPDRINLLGTNHTVTADHALEATPAACGGLEREQDK
jgi:hypothetical protein